MSEGQTPPEIVLQRYQLQKHLQTRDQTTTWHGQDLETQQNVVVKILSLNQIDNWQAYTLFEREAKALKALDHPRIPHLLAFESEPEQQRMILVQQAVEGKSLRVRTEQGWKPNEDQVRQLASEVLGLLQVLHTQSPPLIHRDIKPENLLLDAKNKVYLIDFGAVREFAQASYTVAGSFQYMAPEQLSGKAEPASDLYALGMTLIELLSGSLDSLPREGLYLKFQEHVFVSEGLKCWLEHMVSPYPVQRFSSAQAALEALSAPEFLVKLEQRGKFAAGHGKQELTPNIWLEEKDNDLTLEFIGSVINPERFFKILMSAVLLVGLILGPILAAILNSIYYWITLSNNIDILFVLGGTLIGTAMAIVFIQKNMARTSERHSLTLNEDALSHDFKVSGLLRKNRTHKFLRKHIKRICLDKYQVRIYTRPKFFLKTYRFTLAVPFTEATRQKVALAFAKQGIQTDVK